MIDHETALRTLLARWVGGTLRTAAPQGGGWNGAVYRVRAGCGGAERELIIKLDRVRGAPAMDGDGADDRVYFARSWSLRPVHALLRRRGLPTYDLLADGFPSAEVPYRWQIMSVLAGTPIKAGVDSGRVWVNEFGTRVSKVSPDGNTILGPFFNGSTTGLQGLAIAGDGDAWISSSLSCAANCTIGHLKNDGTFVGNVPNPTGTGSTGVAVDAAGKIWTANRSANTATRIDPAAGPLGGTGCGSGTRVGAVDLTVNFPAGPSGRPLPITYNYSDMTGAQLLGIAPQGTWTVVQDGGAAGTAWGKVTWNTEAQGSVPAGTSITVEARAADSEAGLGSQTFVAVTNGAAFSLTGCFLQVRVTLKPDSEGTSPVLSDIRIQTANKPPTANAGGPYSGNEGATIPLSGTASDPDNDSLTYAWTVTPGAGTDPGAARAITNGNTLTPTIKCTDDGQYTATLTVSDGKADPVSSSTTVTVANLPPSLTITSPTNGAVVAVSTSMNLVAPFTDPGTSDTHTCLISWGDGKTTGPFAAAGNNCNQSHTYTTQGEKTIQVTVTDDDGAPDTESVKVVVFAFVPGGGAFVLGDGGDHRDVVGRPVERPERPRRRGGPERVQGVRRDPERGPAHLRGTWTTGPGNSPPPAAGSLPAYMAVLVTSDADKTGNTVSATIVKIVVVKTNPGYSSSPGHEGTGTIVATVCG